jgi:hypothetical protein
MPPSTIETGLRISKLEQRHGEYIIVIVSQVSIEDKLQFCILYMLIQKVSKVHIHGADEIWVRKGRDCKVTICFNGCKGKLFCFNGCKGKLFRHEEISIDVTPDQFFFGKIFGMGASI